MSRLSRAEMGQAIMDVCAGQSSEESFKAQADALATGVGGTMCLSGGSKGDALAYLEALYLGMRDHIENNWGSIESNTH